MTVKLALLGAGRIGQAHSRAIAQTPGAELVAVSDVNIDAAAAIAHQHGCATASLDAIAKDPNIDGVLICTPTDLHADQIEKFVTAGKAVFCEKPIDLDSARVKACLEVVKAHQGFLMIGFNRRFDPHFNALYQAIQAGQIGTPEMVVITSRDPAPPPAAYIRKSGGIFRDMTIHDFDMAVHLLGEMPVSVQASGSVLTDSEIGTLGDFDTASVILKMASGKQAVITNSRRASYGYDQRVEVHGSEAMIVAENQRPVSIEIANNTGFHKPPLHDFFMTRYIQAYADEIASFVQAVTEGTPPSPSGQDGLNALYIADAAQRAAQTGTVIALSPAGD
ncbi:MAG: inositol 2-dehydrogenase [Candidatus Puniceispirillaceae bacterium]